AKAPSALGRERAEEPLHGALADRDAELGPELADDPLRAPTRLLEGDVPDQGLHLLGDPAPAHADDAAAASPEDAPALASPADQRRGGEDDQELAPARYERGERREDRPVRGIGLDAPSLTGEPELFEQESVLGGELDAVAGQGAEEDEQ